MNDFSEPRRTAHEPDPDDRLLMALHKAVRSFGRDAESGPECAQVLSAMLIAHVRHQLREGHTERRMRRVCKWVGEVAEETAFVTEEELLAMAEECRRKIREQERVSGITLQQTEVSNAIDHVLRKLARDAEDPKQAVTALSLTLAGVLRLAVLGGCPIEEIQYLWLVKWEHIRRLAFAECDQLVRELRAY